MSRTWKDPAGAGTPNRAGIFGKLECADLTTVVRPDETTALPALLCGVAL
ncbi:MAG: hypothetical protein H7Y60_12885 [Rhodospirillaceae bacterium]|nr:hypothetical protein [Rhodospirillales bacterium]